MTASHCIQMKASRPAISRFTDLFALENPIKRRMFEALLGKYFLTFYDLFGKR